MNIYIVVRKCTGEGIRTYIHHEEIDREREVIGNNNRSLVRSTQALHDSVIAVSRVSPQDLRSVKSSSSASPPPAPQKTPACICFHRFQKSLETMCTTEKKRIVLYSEEPQRLRKKNMCLFVPISICIIYVPI